MRERRDPRAKRQACLLAGAERPRFSLTPALKMPSVRLRRDPRVLRKAATIMADLRPRIGWHLNLTGAEGGIARQTAAGYAATEPAIRIIADPAFMVLAVPDHPGRALSDHDRQLIGAARQFADRGGGAVVVLTAAEIQGLDIAGADRVMTLTAGQWGEYDPEGRAAAVIAAMDMLKPRHVLFPESAESGADLARRVAALSQQRLFSGVEDISAHSVSRRMSGGAREMLSAPMLLISIAENACLAHEGPRHEARKLEAPHFSTRRRIESVAPLAIEADLIPLSDADFILSGGNGVTDWQGFAELGRVLGATLAGSRVVCDEGHLPRDRQVGASGSLITARCYLAFGISGAPQHLQGITKVKHVIAINTDLHADMIKRADLAIIDDAQAVIPALIRHARERRHA